MKQMTREILGGVRESFILCAEILAMIVLPIVAFVNHKKPEDDKSKVR